MAQYRKKPVVVEAYQTSEDMDIYTLEGVMHASAGGLHYHGNFR
ncbi:MAG: hypothetical protein ACLVEX_06685 [Ruthenibacterium lactatiformans]